LASSYSKATKKIRSKKIKDNRDIPVMSAVRSSAYQRGVEEAHFPREADIRREFRHWLFPPVYG
jgi:hypothetical protein